MRIYKATVIDRCDTDPKTGEHPQYESYVAVLGSSDITLDPEDYILPDGFSDDDIHHYFEQDEWEKNLQADGIIENEEFTYWVGGRVA